MNWFFCAYTVVSFQYTLRNISKVWLIESATKNMSDLQRKSDILPEEIERAVNSLELCIIDCVQISRKRKEAIAWEDTSTIAFSDK